MTKRFRLYWLRDSACDLGTPLDADELDEAIRARVVELARAHGLDNNRTVDLYLPFLDGRESRRRAESLRGVTLVRDGDAIRSVPATAAAKLRDTTAMLLATHPAWIGAPDERHPRYFQTWQAVSVALQKALRCWIPEIYFRDPSRYEYREAAYPLLVYACSRPCRGRPRTEFAYDMADQEVLPRALHLAGASLQRVLATVERRLYDGGRPALARRYAPRWHRDVLRTVQKKPQPLLDLLGNEAAVVNALVSLGSGRKMRAVSHSRERPVWRSAPCMGKTSVRWRSACWRKRRGRWRRRPVRARPPRHVRR
jgi:hypothetical protein